LNVIAYDLLVAERWRAAQRLSEVGVAVGSGDAWLDLAMQVNTWIARKQTEGAEAIRAEVEAWDVSALKPEFTLARAALLEERDEAFRLIPKLLANGSLLIESLSTWPLFRELRADPRFEDLVKRPPVQGLEAGAESDSDEAERHLRPVELPPPDASAGESA
jgi:hypothetical protein